MPFNIREELKNIDESSRERIVRIFEEAERRFQQRVLELADENLTTGKIQSTLTFISQEAQKLSTDIQPVVREFVESSYEAGIKSVDGRMEAADVEFTPFEKFSAAQVEQVKAITNQNYLNFAESLQAVTRTTNKVLNEMLRRQIRDRIAIGIPAGESVENIARGIRNELFTPSGITSFITKNGARMSLSTYSRMLTRTMIIQSANDGILARSGELGLTVFQVSTHSGGAEDDLCARQQGKIYDTTGEKYPKPNDEDIPPYHPNCRHIWNPRPDLQFSVESTPRPQEEDQGSFAGINFENGIDFNVFS